MLLAAFFIKYILVCFHLCFSLQCMKAEMRDITFLRSMPASIKTWFNVENFSRYAHIAADQTSYWISDGIVLHYFIIVK